MRCYCENCRKNTRHKLTEEGELVCRCGWYVIKKNRVNYMTSYLKKLILGNRKVFDFIGTSKIYKSIMMHLVRREIDRTHKNNDYILCLETTTLCNAKCTFCVHPNMTRQKTLMTDVVFDDILKKLDFVPVGISMNGMGDPLTDSKIFDRIKVLRDRFPSTKIKFHTNLALLKDDKIFNSGLSEVNVSFNGLNKEEYERRMGLTYTLSLYNLHELIRVNNGKMAIKISCVLEDYTGRQKEMAEFKRHWESKPNVVVTFNIQTGWLGKVATDIEFDPKPLPCRQPFKIININPIGNMFLCCLDANQDFIWGNIKDYNSLTDAIKSRKETEMYKNHLNQKVRNIEICKHCDFDSLHGLDWLKAGEV